MGSWAGDDVSGDVMNILLCSPKCTVNAVPAAPDSTDYIGVCVCVCGHTHSRLFITMSHCQRVCACVSGVCVCVTQGVPV